jgi:hypothetical protein
MLLVPVFKVVTSVASVRCWIYCKSIRRSACRNRKCHSDPTFVRSVCDANRRYLYRQRHYRMRSQQHHESMITQNNDHERHKNESVPIEQQKQQLSLIGGTSTYIGLSSTFDAKANPGQHIPIDTRYIPSSLIEWGYVPSTLETLVVESVHENRTSSTTTTQQHEEEDIFNISPSTLLSSSVSTSTSELCTDMTRSITTILPATGCDNDNLETISTTEQYTMGRTTVVTTTTTPSTNDDTNTTPTSLISTLHQYCTSTTKNSNGALGIETCFRWLPNRTSRTHLHNDHNEDYDDNDIYRIRVNVDLQQAEITSDMTRHPNHWQFSHPIRVSIEKRLQLPELELSSNVYTNPFRGGGLDSRTVTQWLGPCLHSDAIRSYPTRPIASDVMSALIAHNNRKNNNNTDSNIHCTREIILPCNITISTRVENDCFDIMIGHIEASSHSNNRWENTATDTTSTEHGNTFPTDTTKSKVTTLQRNCITYRITTKVAPRSGTRISHMSRQ